MKKISKLFFVITTLILTIATLFIAYVVMRYEQAPQDSSAIYGGRVDEFGYPFAGYLISYENNNKASVCGSVYLSNKVAISAAHCIKPNTSVFLGFDEYKFNPSSNIQATDVVTKPEWDGNDNNHDLAVLISNNKEFTKNQYAEIGDAKVGCNYEVLGYGSTENDEQLPDGKRLRKSALLCVEKIEANLIYFKGQGGGICFGDSGSPVFEKGTNKVVGIVSGIISERNSNEYCSIDNRAVAVRIDRNISFISQYDLVPDQNLALCSQSCANTQCSNGLTCNADKICVSSTSNSCIVQADNFCSTLSNIQCFDGASCISNKCIIDTVDAESFGNGYFANFSLDNIINSENKSIIYITIGVISLILSISWFILSRIYNRSN